jgi:hypothetical protein
VKDMIINKRISIASLDIDTDTGRIWLNAPNCILRIQKINFKNQEDKFAMIDINQDSAYMIPGDFGTSKYTEFLEKMNTVLLPKVIGMGEEIEKKFLDVLYSKIQDCVKEEKV